MADCKISEFMKMQRIQAKQHGWDKNRIPELGHKSLLWAVGEIGEDGKRTAIRLLKELTR